MPKPFRDRHGLEADEPDVVKAEAPKSLPAAGGASLRPQTAFRPEPENAEDRVVADQRIAAKDRYWNEAAQVGADTAAEMRIAMDEVLKVRALAAGRR